MPFVDRDEVRLAFEDTGEGRAITMSHSFLCSREMWAYQAAELSSSYRVVNLDLRGHGDSGPAEDPFTPYDLVDDVVTVLDHLGIERAVWCGLSIGGMTALRAALTVPDRVDALIVADATGGRDAALTRLKYSLMGRAAKLVGTRRLMPRVLPIMFGPTALREQPELVAEWSERMASVDIGSLLNVLEVLQNRDVILDRLGEIRVPTLIMVGEEDRGQPPARSRELERAIPGAELVIIPEAGHLSALEQPEVVNEVMHDFLRDAFPGEV